MNAFYCAQVLYRWDTGTIASNTVSTVPGLAGKDGKRHRKTPPWQGLFSFLNISGLKFSAFVYRMAGIFSCVLLSCCEALTDPTFSGRRRNASHSFERVRAGQPELLLHLATGATLHRTAERTRSAAVLLREYPPRVCVCLPA